MATAVSGYAMDRMGHDPNQVLVGLNNLIDQDIEMQKADLGMAKWQYEKMDMRNAEHLENLEKEYEMEFRERGVRAAQISNLMDNLRDRVSNRSSVKRMQEIASTFLKSHIEGQMKSMLGLNAISQLKEEAYLRRDYQRRMQGETFKAIEEGRPAAMFGFPPVGMNPQYPVDDALAHQGEGVWPYTHFVNAATGQKEEITPVHEQAMTTLKNTIRLTEQAKLERDPVKRLDLLKQVTDFQRHDKHPQTHPTPVSYTHLTLPTNREV